MMDQAPPHHHGGMQDARGAADQAAAAAAEQHATALSKQLGVQHVCDHRCSVQHLFGNAYRCDSSGQVHVCDANCAQRIYNDRYSTVCRVSRRVFHNAWVVPQPCRKRSCSMGEEGASPDACRKRGPGAAAAPGVAAYYAAGAASQEDAMVM